MIAQTRTSTTQFYNFPHSEANAFLTILEETIVWGDNVRQDFILQVISTNNEGYWECRHPGLMGLARCLMAANETNEKEVLNHFLVALHDADHNGAEIPEWVLSTVSRGAGVMIPLEII